MEQLLIDAGLSQPQAATYLFLLEHGASAPPTLTKHLSITRTNAYKVLDSLEDIGLANKQEIRKKFVYHASDPSALAALVARKRNDVIALEQHVNATMQELRATYRKSSSDSTNVEIKEGKPALMQTYEDQASLQQPIYFIKSRSDIPFLGFEAMDRARGLTQKHSTPRFGIMPDGAESPAVDGIDKRTNLTRTWVNNEAYTAPVEWTVSGNDVHIQIFKGDGRVVHIRDGDIAESFRELWKLLDTSLRADPKYAFLPQRAERTV